MKNQNNQCPQSSLPAAILTMIVMLFASLGCSDFTKGFKEGYDKGRGTPSSNSSSGGNTATRPDLAEDIVGRWEMTGNGKTLAFDFSPNLTVESFMDGKSLSKGTYKVIDEHTIETRNSDGSVTEMIPIKIEGSKMTMTYQNTNLILIRR